MDNKWDYGRPPSAIDFVQNNFLSNGIRIVIHFFVRFSLHYYHRYEAIGSERLHDLKGKIIVANHASHLDVLALFSAFPLSEISRVRTFAAKDYFFSNPILRYAAFFFANIIPIDRQGWGAESLNYAGCILHKGGVIIVFPEGTRSLDGEIHCFRPGIGLLALKQKAQVIPVYIKGTYACQKKGTWIPRADKIKVFIGNICDYAAMVDQRGSCEAIARDLEQKVKALQKEAEKC